MSNLAQALALANEEAETGIDMNEATAGGSRLLPQGYAFARLVEYIELGKQPQEFGGQKKDPALEVSLGFALWGKPPGSEETYHNEDGTPYIIRPYSFALGRNEKATAYKLFKALNWDGTAKNFAQLLGRGFLAKIVHKPKSKTDATLVARIDFAGFLPPNDPATGAPYPIPEASDDLYKLFLWNRPTKAGWDALFIEGQYEAKDGKPAKSKNRVQETILSALDFQGSALQALLLENGVAVPQAAVAVAAAPEVAPVAAPLAQAPSTPPATVAAVPVVAPAASPAIASVPAVPQVSTTSESAQAATAVPSVTPTPATASPSEVAAPVVAAPAIAAVPAIPALPA